MVNGQPLFSIVTACRNSSSTIERTILSVLRQSFNDYEYQIVDGASTDSTVEIIKKYAPLFKGKLNWISERDTGIYNAFNKGIKMCRGKYIWIVNSDDWIEDDALNNLYTFIKNNPKPIIIGRMNLVSNNKKITKTSSMLSDIKVKETYEKDYMIPHPATLISSNTYQLHGYYDERLYIAADMDYFNMLYKKNVEMAYLNEVIINFSYGGISTNKLYRKELRDRHLIFLKKYGHSMHYLMAMVRWHLHFIKDYIK